MKILMLSTDRNAFCEGSAVRERFAAYGRYCTSLHVIVFSKRGYRTEAIAPNVFLHPTDSISRWRYIADAARVGKALPRPDIVTAQDPFETGLTGWRLSRFFGAKLELQVHTDFLSPFFARHSLLNFLRRPLARFLLPKADGIRVVSSRIKESLERAHYPLKTVPSVLPIWSDAERIMAAVPQFSLKERYPGFDFIALTVSRLEKEKNVMLGLKAMARVIREYPRVGYIVAGDGSEKKGLERAAGHLGITANVRFVGWQDNLAAYYKGADVYLSTSDYEGYGLSLAEAALSGCPIVATDAGIAGSLLKHGEAVLVCPPGDAARLSREIKRAVNDPELRKKLKRTALASLLAALPKDSGAYYAEIAGGWRAVAERKKRLLILTQKMDRKDTVLGFFHRWTEEFSKHCERLSVVCLYEGEHRLPPNVKVLSLGKERHVSRFSYVLNFYRHIWNTRREYDTVFVHMNPIYILLGGFLWRLWGKRIGLWYTHKSVDWKLRMSLPFTHVIFTASRESFRAKSGKVVVTGHGIDTDIFIPKADESKGEIVTLVSIGRLSPVKKHEIAIEMVSILKGRGKKVKLLIIGGVAQTSDNEYHAFLVREVARRNLADAVSFLGPLSSHEMLPYLQKSDILVNASETGSLDKVVLEAMSAGVVPLTSNIAFAEMLSPFGLFSESGKAEEMSMVAEEVIEKEDIGELKSELRDIVVKHHNLKTLVSALLSTYAPPSNI